MKPTSSSRSKSKRLIAATNSQTLANNSFSSSLPINDSSFQTAVVDDDGCMEELPTPLFDNRTKINMGNRDPESHDYQYNVLSLYQQESQSYQLDAYSMKQNETTSKESNTRVDRDDGKEESSKHKKQSSSKTNSNTHTHKNSLPDDKSRRNNSRICENSAEYKHDFSQGDDDILYKTFITTDSRKLVTESRETCEGFRAGIQWIIHSDTPGGHWLQPLKLVKGIEALEDETDNDVNPTAQNPVKPVQNVTTNVTVGVDRNEKRDNADHFILEKEDRRIKQTKDSIIQDQIKKSNDKQEKSIQRLKSNIETSTCRDQNRSRSTTRDRDGKISRSSSDITGSDEPKLRRRRRKPLQDVVDTGERPSLERQHSGQSLCQYVETSLLHQPQLPNNDLVERNPQRTDNRKDENQNITTKIDEKRNKKSFKKTDDGKLQELKKATSMSTNDEQKYGKRGEHDRTKGNNDSKHRADTSKRREESIDLKRHDSKPTALIVKDESKVKRCEKESKIKDSKRKVKSDTQISENQSDDYPIRQERVSIQHYSALDASSGIITHDEVLTSETCTETKQIPIESNEDATMKANKSKDKPLNQSKGKKISHSNSIEKLAKLNMSWDAEDPKPTDEEASIDPLNGFIPHKVRHGEKKPLKKTEEMLNQNQENDNVNKCANDLEDPDRSQNNTYDETEATHKHLSRSSSNADEAKNAQRKKNSMKRRSHSMEEQCQTDSQMKEIEAPNLVASLKQDTCQNDEKIDNRFEGKQDESTRRSSRSTRKKDPLESKSEHSTFSSPRRHGSNDSCLDTKSDHGNTYHSGISSLYSSNNNKLSKKEMSSANQDSTMNNSSETPCSNTQNSCSSGEASAVFSVGVGIQYLNQGNEAKVRHQQAAASCEMSFAQLNFNLFGTSEHQPGGVKFVDNDQVAAAAEVVSPPLEQSFVKLPANERLSREEIFTEVEDDSPDGVTKPKSKSNKKIGSGSEEAAAGKKGQVVRSKSLFSSRTKSNDDSAPVSPMKAIRTFSLRRPGRGDEIPSTDKANTFVFRNSTKPNDMPELQKKSTPSDEKGKEKKTKMKKFLSFGNASTDWGNKAALSCLIEDDDIDDL